MRFRFHRQGRARLRGLLWPWIFNYIVEVLKKEAEWIARGMWYRKEPHGSTWLFHSDQVDLSLGAIHSKAVRMKLG